jgi:hypothetical protein
MDNFFRNYTEIKCSEKRLSYFIKFLESECVTVIQNSEN